MLEAAILFFFLNNLVCWRPKFSIFLNSSHNWVEFGTIFWSAFGILGGFEHPKRPLGKPLVITQLLLEDRNIYLHRYLEILEIRRYALPGVTVQGM